MVVVVPSSTTVTLYFLLQIGLLETQMDQLTCMAPRIILI